MQFSKFGSKSNSLFALSLLFLSVLGVLFPEPLLAQPDSEQDHAQAADPDFAALSDSELLVFARDRKWLFEGPSCARSFPLFQELSRRYPEMEFFDRSSLYFEILCADEQKEYGRAQEGLDQLEARYPSPNWQGLGLYLNRRNDAPEKLLDRLAGLDGDFLEQMSPEGFWPIVRFLNGHKMVSQFEDLALVWLDDGRFARLDSDIQQGVASYALKAAVRATRADVTDELLSYIRSPQIYVSMLASREFGPIWPQIEARVGPNLSIVSRDYAQWASARLENHREDRDRFSTAARAYYFAGDFSQAIELAQDWQARDARGIAIEEGDGWALNIEAYAYDALGKRAQADAVFDNLAELDPEDHPWVVSFVINRASRLVGQKRWEQGLAANALAQGVADVHGNTFANMILAHNRVCAFNALGRGDETGDDIAFLLTNSSDGYELAAAALMCLKRRQEAADLLIEGLQDQGRQEHLIEELQGERFELFYTPSSLPQISELLAEFPLLAQEFDKFARPIPSAFVPVAYLKRRE